MTRMSHLQHWAPATQPVSPKPSKLLGWALGPGTKVGTLPVHSTGPSLGSTRVTF